MKNTSQPLVSVIVTAYNAALYLKEALNSLVSQTYKNIEIIVVNDGSTDSTRSILKEFALTNPRFKIYNLKSNHGCSYSSNFALARAKGKYIARLDADDVAYPTRLELQVKFMEAHPKIVMLGGQCDIINESGALIGQKSFPLSHTRITASLFEFNPIQHPACMFRSATLKTANIKYDPQYLISHDLKIVFQLLKWGRLANLPQKVLCYRHRPGSLTHRNPKLVFKETVELRNWAWRQGLYHPSIYGIIFYALQLLAVSVLPNRAINWLFQLWRVKKIVNPLPSLRLALNSAASACLLWLVKNS